MEDSNYNPPLVSIVCITYNHAPYIKDALDSFLMQKTSFPFEIIIHDDASTDSTADIIHEYERKYPEIIRAIYQDENQYSQRINFIGKYICPLVRGKYIALCEGDDFWTDKEKLQRQFEALETHPDCHLCVHDVTVFNCQQGIKTKRLPGGIFKQGVVSGTDIIKKANGYNTKTCTFFMKSSDYCEIQMHPPKFKQMSSVGDEVNLLYFASIGNMFYIHDVMACYRYLSVGSWTSKQSKATVTVSNKKDNLLQMVDVLMEYDIFTEGVYHSVLLNRIASLVSQKNEGLFRVDKFFAQNFDRNLEQKDSEKMQLKVIQLFLKKKLRRIRSLIRVRKHLKT